MPTQSQTAIARHAAQAERNESAGVGAARLNDGLGVTSLPG